MELQGGGRGSIRRQVKILLSSDDDEDNNSLDGFVTDNGTCEDVQGLWCVDMVLRGCGRTGDPWMDGGLRRTQPCFSLPGLA